MVCNLLNNDLSVCEILWAKDAAVWEKCKGNDFVFTQHFLRNGKQIIWYDINTAISGNVKQTICN